MNRCKAIFAALFLAAIVFIPSVSFAAKTYQVTGMVVKLTDKTITVQKPNDEKWEIDRGDAAKVTGDLKVGSKVTIEYTMTATDIEVKN